MYFVLSKSKFFKTAILLVVTLLTVAVFVYLTPQVFAQASLGIESLEDTGLGTADLKLVIVRIVQVIMGFLGIIAVIVILYGGYIYMTSKGELDQITKAKQILLNGVIGLIIILSAFAIVTYIINRMQDATTEGDESPTTTYTIDIDYGALGGGILESVYPEPGATDVPRNTLIMVSFKEEMDISTLIGAAHPDCPPLVTCGILAGDPVEPNVRIINRNDNDSVLANDKVMVMTSDNKNFVFDPYGLSGSYYLGDPNGYTDYAVNLTDNINKGDGSPAFLVGGYTWFFQVSNVLDLTPPQVVSVIPFAESEVYMNAVVQIDFNEAVNAAAVVGQVLVDANGQLLPDSFDNILASYQDPIKYVSGNFFISNSPNPIESYN